MPVSPWIGSHRVFFDVRADGVRREVQQDTSCSLTPRAMIDQLKSRDVRDEIRIPRAVALDDPTLTAEIFVFAAKAIGKFEGIIDDEIQIAKPVDHHRRVCKRNESRRFISLNVEMLAPGVKRRRKHTALLPFESLLAATLGPNTGSAAPFDHVDQLLEQVAFRQSLSLRRNFTKITVTTTACAKEIDKGSGSSLTLPRLHHHRGQVVDSEPPVNRNAFGLLPQFIRRFVNVCGLLGKIQTHVPASFG